MSSLGGDAEAGGVPVGILQPSWTSGDFCSGRRGVASLLSG